MRSLCSKFQPSIFKTEGGYILFLSFIVKHKIIIKVLLKLFWLDCEDIFDLYFQEIEKVSLMM